jgi:hypothetical protein
MVTRLNVMQKIIEEIGSAQKKRQEAGKSVLAPFPFGCSK